MAVQCANSAGQLVNTSTNIAVPIVYPYSIATTANDYTFDVWINANWGSSAAPRGRRSFCGIYGPAQRTQGLVAQYYANKTLTDPPNTVKVDATPYINTATGAPPPGTSITNDVFGVRWTGYFIAPTTGTYYFQTYSDDGIRVTINGTVVINNYTDHSPTTDTATVTVALTAGQSYTLLIEYYNQGGTGNAQLSYRVGTTGTFTVTTQSMYATSAPTANAMTAMQIGTASGSGEVSCWTYGGSSLITTANDYAPTANNTWINVTYVFDSSVDSHLLYVNGKLAVVAAGAQQEGSLKYIVINGYYAGGAAETDNHYVDSVSLYNRALSAAEIQTLNTSAGNRHGDNYGLIADYEFDEGAEGVNVASSLDLTGSGATLLLTGTGTAPKYSYSISTADANTRPPLFT